MSMIWKLKEIQQILRNEFLLENPKLPNRLAAKLLKQKYDAVFKDVDDARYIIRYVKGKAGKANQTKILASFLQRLEDLKTENLSPAEHLDLADFESSAKISGNGFYFLKDELALLNQALISFAINFMTSKDYTYIEPPQIGRAHV